MLISDWSSDVCSSDLTGRRTRCYREGRPGLVRIHLDRHGRHDHQYHGAVAAAARVRSAILIKSSGTEVAPREGRSGSSRGGALFKLRSEEHTSELQSLMRISYAVFCLKKKQEYKN